GAAGLEAHHGEQELGAGAKPLGHGLDFGEELRRDVRVAAHACDAVVVEPRAVGVLAGLDAGAGGYGLDWHGGTPADCTCPDYMRTGAAVQLVLTLCRVHAGGSAVVARLHHQRAQAALGEALAELPRRLADRIEALGGSHVRLQHPTVGSPAEHEVGAGERRLVQAEQYLAVAI